jgi:hypothetical protein
MGVDELDVQDKRLGIAACELAVCRMPFEPSRRMSDKPFG